MWIVFIVIINYCLHFFRAQQLLSMVQHLGTAKGAPRAAASPLRAAEPDSSEAGGVGSASPIPSTYTPMVRLR